MNTKHQLHQELSFEEFKQEVLADYKLGWESRFSSIWARKEVLRGKAKFGIMGAGKELPQIVLSKFFENGDYRAGYYRDQTMVLATGGISTAEQFSLLYADTEEQQGGGRQMSSHFATRLLDENGQWKSHLLQKNHSADAAPTASQMGRAVGLGLASSIYRKQWEQLQHMNLFSNKGNEVCFATIGDASTSEGIFFEAINAAGVLQIPVVFNIWDDGYGISVPKKYQTTKSSISEALAGFKADENSNGFEIFTVKAWDYAALLQTYKQAVDIARTQHKPVIVHVLEATQPLGHSTSGSHERYKTPERLAWEKEFDCLKTFKEWIHNNAIATEEELDNIEQKAEEYVKQEMNKAWESNFTTIHEEIKDLVSQLQEVDTVETKEAINTLQQFKLPKRGDIDILLRNLKIKLRRDEENHAVVSSIYEMYREHLSDIYHSHLFPESKDSAFEISEVPCIYSQENQVLNGYEILQQNFDHIFATRPEVVAFGEDLGKIGGVNQAFAGLQDKYGINRIFDVGIREGTIVGQAIGLAMRGLRPIAEIQYLDYIYYGLQQLADEVATISYRTNGGQKCPIIIRTRGHRLEGIWHSGSPLGMMIHALRGIHIAVPRNMTQAAGFYNTFLESDEPAIVIEPLNAYRLKEACPDNLMDIRIPIGKIETLQQGTDVTLVTYGSCVRIAQEAIEQLDQLGISVELIDVQTLLPFDLNHDIVESLKKTNRIAFLDEDVPGGATSFMMQKVLEEQGGYHYLDSMPITITATEHRPGYGSDHNHFSKPMPIDVVEEIYSLMHETNPEAYPAL